MYPGIHVSWPGVTHNFNFHFIYPGKFQDPGYISTIIHLWRISGEKEVVLFRKEIHFFDIYPTHICYYLSIFNMDSIPIIKTQ